MIKIVIVTGSRNWRYRRFVWMVLNSLYVRNGSFTLYHGDCRDRQGNPCGADADAQAWADTVRDIEVRRFPADWDRYGTRAGPIRNRAMVQTAYREAGAEAVQGVAFPRGGSTGTRGTIRLMDGYKINCRVWEAEEAARFLRYGART